MRLTNTFHCSLPGTNANRDIRHGVCSAFRGDLIIKTNDSHVH